MLDIKLMLNDLKLKMFNYESEKKLFHNINLKENYKRNFEFTAEFIKIIKYLKKNHVQYKEIQNGDILILQ